MSRLLCFILLGTAAFSYADEKEEIARLKKENAALKSQSKVYQGLKNNPAPPASDPNAQKGCVAKYSEEKNWAGIEAVAGVAPAFMFAADSAKYCVDFSAALVSAHHGSNELEGEVKAQATAKSMQEAIAKLPETEPSRRAAFRYLFSQWEKRLTELEEAALAESRAAQEEIFQKALASFEAEKKWVKNKCAAMESAFGTPANEQLIRQFERDYLTKAWLECSGLEDFASSWVANSELSHCQVFGRLVDMRARVDAISQFAPTAERSVASEPAPKP